MDFLKKFTFELHDIRNLVLVGGGTPTKGKKCIFGKSKIMEKRCQYCDAVVKGRADKKFCDDSCRNAYNNQQNSDSTNLMRNVNNILRKNRRILEELNPEGKTKVTKAKMLEKGFNFGYHTSLTTTKAGATYIFCYEYGYLALENDFYLLVQRIENSN